MTSFFFSSFSLAGIQKIADEINQSVEVSESTKAVHELAKQIPDIHVRRTALVFGLSAQSIEC